MHKQFTAICWYYLKCVVLLPLGPNWSFLVDIIACILVLVVIQDMKQEGDFLSGWNGMQTLQIQQHCSSFCNVSTDNLSSLTNNCFNGIHFWQVMTSLFARDDLIII
jgi:hypothetical protein